MARKKPAPKGKNQTPATVYQIKITLLGTKPPVWRRIQVADCSLDALHDHIQTAMGWTNSHLHDFRHGDELYGHPEIMQENFEDMGYHDSTTTLLSALIPEGSKRLRLRYQYDFGDSWEHEVLVEKAIAPEPGQKYPLCIAGARACPPEDCGGVWGYDDFLVAIRDKKHEQHKELLEWIGGEFDPEAFDAEAVTKRMKQGLPNWRALL